jgi:hypothetical protein
VSGPDHDFEELDALFQGASGRYCSAQATIVHRVHADVARWANRRFVDWRFEHGGGFGMERENGGEWRRQPREHFYRTYEDSEHRVRLWHERPDRWREEWRVPDGSMLRCVVFGGARGPRWVYEPPHTAIHDVALPEPWPREDPFTDLSFMLDPSEDLFSYALLDDATVHKTGRTTRVAGREAVEVLVATISWGYPPSIFHGYDAAMEGTTDHLLLVDQEIGTLLRVAARLDGREFRVAEAAEISYDEEPPKDTFRLGVPGVEFR